MAPQETMNKFDRLRATFSGDPLDRWAYALWKHFPGNDRTHLLLMEVIVQLTGDAK
jgi:hypothetical protein